MGVTYSLYLLPVLPGSGQIQIAHPDEENGLSHGHITVRQGHRVATLRDTIVLCPNLILPSGKGCRTGLSLSLDPVPPTGLPLGIT